MFVGETGNFYIETTHPAYGYLHDFFIACCEPVSRTQNMEQYMLHSASLSAASAEDLEKYKKLEEWAQSEDAFRNPLGFQNLDLKTKSTTTGTGEKEVKKVLSLKRRKMETEAISLLETSSIGRALGVSSAETKLQPLVSVVVTRPELLVDIPQHIEELLLEEENSSKLRVVLQPRLRSFTSNKNATGKEVSVAEKMQVSVARADDEQLFYFIVSHDRKHMEYVVEHVKEYLEPVMLYGSPRYIVSDIDRGVEEKGYEEEIEIGRAAAMKRLFDPLKNPLVQTVDGNNSSAMRWRDRNHRRLLALRESKTRILFKCQVKEGKLRNLKDQLHKQHGIRADCFYDYLQDKTIHVENLQLAKHVRLRSYQVASLERFRRGNKAHQGVVVLPCGAGKTLTGIGAASTIQKRTIVLTVNNMSVFQWRNEFLKWTNLREDEVTVCTVKQKDTPGPVFITTYSMLITKRGEAKGIGAQQSEEIIEKIQNGVWGLLLLDEVHTAPAKNFQEVLNKIKFKCVLGLSATLLREDGKIDDLRHLVGPKLYEANWLQLTKDGFLAKVECAEIQCPIPIEFLNAYSSTLKSASFVEGSRSRKGAKKMERESKQRSLDYLAHSYASCNPYKLWCTQALLSFHQSRSPPDKVIIFCDFLTEVHYYSKHLHIPYMSAETGENERKNLLDYFQFSDLNALILTRVGDVALDIPCASVIIQISGLGASRRQEAQRLGRILRPKPPSLDNTCSYFYTLVSKDTKEVLTSYGRQSWLRDQGFAYRVLDGENVLSEFKKMGGKLLCVGPPQWWYQVPEPSSSPGSPGGVAGKTLESSVVLYDNKWWSSFSPVASETIHAAFQRGKPGCSLSGKESFGDGVIPPSYSCEINFSSTDAPLTFGTVSFNEVVTSGITVETRRITFGRLDETHVCMHESSRDDSTLQCIDYAVTYLDRFQKGKRRNEVQDLSAPDDTEDDESGDENDYFDDFSARGGLF